MASLKFITRTAIRDSRKNRGRLALFMSSILLGISALVAINSFNDNVVDDINNQAASLLGADLDIDGNKEASEYVMSAIDSLDAILATEVELLTMSYMPQQDASQFVRLKALEGPFPFYGKLKTEPVEAAERFRQNKTVVVDESMLFQYGLQRGDSIRLGKSIFTIEGTIKNAFGGVAAGASFAPTLYISKQYLASTELVQPGSLVEYSYLIKLNDDTDPDEWKAQRRERFRQDAMRIETVNDQKEDVSEAFDSLNYFLNLVALVALLLGCIGVASSVFIYVKSKINSIATFRCLGMKGNGAFSIYFLQIFFLGLIGVVTGAILGSFIQLIIPQVLSDFLPFEVTTKVSWTAVVDGIVIGLIITMLFALIPLLAVRKISPLRTLRASYEQDTEGGDPLRWVVYFAILASLFLFLWRLTGDPGAGATFTIGLVAAFLVLFFVSKGIIWSVKKFFPRNWNFVLRQGIANLFRPNNQTQTLLVSIGLGTSILTTLFIIQGLLLKNVDSMDAGNQPNMVLYGIERTQKDDLAQLTESYNLPVINQVPIVTMALAEWKGKTKAEWFADTTRTARSWAINREARVTYRDKIDPSEKLLKGNFIGTYDPGIDSIYISLSDGYARALDVDLGDELVWNVQGTRIKTYVSSIREIDFASMNTRFFIVFPNGVLEDAPQFQVLVTKSPDTKTTAAYRSAVVKSFPNISVIDLASILSTVNDILNKVSYIIQFMALFSILTGVVVLISSLLLSKYQRIKESVLLRTIGASTKQILQINIAEYAILGALSASTGIIIALVGSFLLAKFQLELDFMIRWYPLLIIFTLVVGLTVFIGMLNNREVVRKSPLEVLRKEV